jgi:hypothetical protein
MSALNVDMKKVLRIKPVPSDIVKALQKQVNSLHSDMEAHLRESGEIKADLKWLKQAFWTLAAGGLTFNVTFVIAVVVYLLNH